MYVLGYVHAHLSIACVWLCRACVCICRIVRDCIGMCVYIGCMCVCMGCVCVPVQGGACIGRGCLHGLSVCLGVYVCVCMGAVCVGVGGDCMGLFT